MDKDCGIVGADFTASEERGEGLGTTTWDEEGLVVIDGNGESLTTTEDESFIFLDFSDLVFKDGFMLDFSLISVCPDFVMAKKK